MSDIRSPRHLYPFSDAMIFGFGVLRLSPECFWSMTPREFRAAARPYLPDATDRRMTQADLSQLMTSFPDYHK